MAPPPSAATDSSAGTKPGAEAPLVSILMSAYNAEPYLEAALQSLLNQTYTNWELLVADDGSTDNTRALLDSYTDPRIRHLHNSQNLNLLPTRNKLFHQTRGVYLTLMDADDTCDPTRLEKLVAALEADPQRVMVCSFALLMDEHGAPLKEITYPTTDAELREAMKVCFPMIGSATMLRLSVLKEQFGFLYRDFFHGKGNEDYDLMIRLSAHGRLANVPEPLYHMRVVTSSASRKSPSLERYLTFHIAKQFYFQRLETGTDDLERGDLAAIGAYQAELQRPYLADPARLHRELSGQYLDGRMPQQARIAAWEAVRRRPLHLYNWRNWFYVWRKTRLSAQAATDR